MKVKLFLSVLVSCFSLVACNSGDEDSGSGGSVGTPTGDVASVDLTTSAAAYALTCLPVTANAKGANGSAIIAAQDTTFDLSTSGGTGSYYSNATCNSSVITSATITQGTSTALVYYENTSPTAVSLNTSYNSVSGNALTANLQDPPIDRITMATTQHTSCVLVSVGLLDSNSSYMRRSTTQTVVITATQTSGPFGAVGAFYTSNDCSTGSLTTGSVSTITIPANSTNKTVYFATGTLGSYSFSMSFTSGSSNGSGYTSGFAL